MDIDKLLASIPTPGVEDVEKRKQWAIQYTLIFLRAGPAQRDDLERNERLQIQHLQHLAKLQQLGLLVLNGPILMDHDILGVSLYAAPVEDARAMASADPKVRAGYLVVEALPWMAVPTKPAP
ncbi:MAG TPA: YciI family protein [Longilinea sp.]|nr:YciI family protein [Longilinea sp.]